MLEKLRQVALMVRNLEVGRELYQQALGMTSCHSEDLSQYGLTNLVLPAGNGTFVELLQPASASTPGGRFLERRGEAPYLLIFETKHYDQHTVKGIPIGPPLLKGETGGFSPAGLSIVKFNSRCEAQ